MLQYSDPEEYINERVAQYQSWYDLRSTRMKMNFLRFRIISVLGSALIPVITNMSAIPLPHKDYLVTVIGLVVVIMVSLDSVFHWGEQWRNYRSTEQVLGREVVFFKTRRGPYTSVGSDEEAFGLLVERCEDAIAVENTATLNVLSIQQQPSSDS
ncbi:MAG: DUF4231 domain-containing protein [Pseudomonadota bacterium]